MPDIRDTYEDFTCFVIYNVNKLTSIYDGTFVAKGGLPYAVCTVSVLVMEMSRLGGVGQECS